MAVRAIAGSYGSSADGGGRRLPGMVLHGGHNGRMCCSSTKPRAATPAKRMDKSPMMQCRYMVMVSLTAFDWPLVCGWNVVFLFNVLMATYQVEEITPDVISEHGVLIADNAHLNSV